MAALAACQASAQVAREEIGAVEIVASGLTFDCDGLAPAPAILARPPDIGEAVRVYPGVHLSGGLTMAPVSRALLALAAELAVTLPVRSVAWHPAGTAIEPQLFSRSVLAWLAGGSFPASGLIALTQLGDGSVASRGLAHFAGQELTVRGDEALAVAVIDRLVREGPLTGMTRWTVHGMSVCLEAAAQAGQVIVCPEAQTTSMA